MFRLKKRLFVKIPWSPVKEISNFQALLGHSELVEAATCNSETQAPPGRHTEHSPTESRLSAETNPNYCLTLKKKKKAIQKQ